jgi:hypothetical protein
MLLLQLLLPFLLLVLSTASARHSRSSSKSFSQRFSLPRKHRLTTSFILATTPWSHHHHPTDVDNDDHCSDVRVVSMTSVQSAAEDAASTWRSVRSLLELRGGQDDEEVSDEEEDSDDDDDDDEVAASSGGMDYAAMVEQVVDVTKTKVIPVVVAASKKTYKLLNKVTLSTYHALQRAVRAAWEGEAEEEEDEEDDEDREVTMADQALKLATKIVKTIKRMVVAALDFPESTEEEVVDKEEEDDEDDEEDGNVDTLVKETKKKVKKTTSVVEEKVENAKDVDSETPAEESTSEPTQLDDTRPETESLASDFGASLAEMYGVNDGRGASASHLVIMGGSFKDALEEAKKQARLLLVLIPADRPNGGRRFLFGGKKQETDGPSKDKVAIESLLSSKVVKAANKKARKKGSDAGSFAVWAAKAGSSEANKVIKLLNVQTSNKGDNVPILAAVYPAYVSVSCFITKCGCGR